MAMSELSDLLYQDSWSDELLLAEFQSMSLDKLKSYAQLLLNSGEFSMLAHGNYEADEVKSYAAMIRQAFNSDVKTAEPVGVVKLTGESVRAVDSIYDDASIALYIQADTASKAARAAMGVTAQIIGAGFYTELRTEKQLGYIVSSGAYPIKDVAGLYFVVQSPVVGPAILQDEINQFIVRQEQSNQALSSEEFERYKDALILRLKEDPKNLSEQSGLYWRDIVDGYTQFDLKQQLIAEIEALSLDQWVQFFSHNIGAGSRRALWVYSAGAFIDQSAVVGRVIDNVPLYKNNSSYYQFD
jgi:secreted Zn-dependent insulinase-like peptidase